MGPQWQYEPKWDGFSCILSRDSTEVVLTSKSGQDLKQYFPEIVAGALGLNAKSYVLDGEIAGSDGVIARRLDLPYQAGNREGMQKIKRYTTGDLLLGQCPPSGLPTPEALVGRCFSTWLTFR